MSSVMVTKATHLERGTQTTILAIYLIILHGTDSVTLLDFTIPISNMVEVEIFY